jgi:tetratricopeptide (TPR) repeat protein
VNRIAMAGVAAVALAGVASWLLLREAPVATPPLSEQDAPPQVRVMGLEEPLPMNEAVDVRWIDQETGEEDVWKVTKRQTSPEDRGAGAALPEPDPNAGHHVPDESARALHAMGLESWKRGEIREAMGQLAEAIEADPDDPLPRTQYGRLQLLAMDYQEALPHLERAAALDPDDPQVWLDLATIYEKTHIMDRAWAAHRRAEELAGDRELYQEEVSGFWVVEGTSIYP